MAEETKTTMLNLRTWHLVLGIVILLIIILAIVFWDDIRKKFKRDAPATTTTPDDGLDYNRVLKKGVTGEEVKKLQQLLGNVEVDGIFGPITEAALLARKGVTSISLTQFGQLPDVTNTTQMVQAQTEEESLMEYEDAMYGIWAFQAPAENGMFQNGVNTSVNWVA